MRKILSTRALPSSVIQQAEQAGASIRVEEFILVRPRLTAADAAAITRLAEEAGLPVIFTSKHAVDIVADHLASQNQVPAPRWQLYCISEVTARRARQRFPAATVTAPGAYGQELAAHILASDLAGPVWFFSGDKRRDTIPGMLTAGGVDFYERVVYETVLTPRKITDFFDGILFFSPSGVESYFQANTPDPRTVLFAIGRTTAEALGHQGSHPVIVSEVQEAGALVRLSTDYLTQK